MSTKYSNLFRNIGFTDVTRANKAFVHGGSNTLSSDDSHDSWKGKNYRPTGMMTAVLMRVSEASTAFGHGSMGSDTHDAGTGIMADTLARKWRAKSTGTYSPSDSLEPQRSELESSFPQLKTVSDMRRQGPTALAEQITTSRMQAAQAAAQRGMDKGFSRSSGALNEYVQRKFAKHGLGNVPSGW